MLFFSHHAQNSIFQAKNNGKMGSVFCIFIHMPKCLFHLEKKVDYPQISSSTSK